ncbi:MAG: RecX family transcriptional regulator [Clostridia bacterium]|nr:RecX family transcriptional regulator [Clostridia bacterium]
MIITDIKKQVNNKSKVSIFADGVYYNSLFDETLAASGLKIGDSFTEEEFQRLQTESQKKLAFNKSLDYISIRIRASSELRKYLERKEYCEEAIEYSVQKLMEYGYLNDETFAKTLVRDRMNARKKGRNYIISDLKKYGIDNEIIQQITDEYDYEKEHENALNLAGKLLLKHKKEEDPYKRKQKISASMARAGYDWETIQSALNEAEKGK